jgi:hypothetical protein
MKMFSRDGVEMMDVKSFQCEGENLILKGKMMGTMPVAIFLRPEDVWRSLSLFSWPVIVRLPLILVKGFVRCRKKPAPSQS